MLKRIIPSASPASAGAETDWLKLENMAEVEVSSEQPDYPIEAALLPGYETGWCASQPGEQIIRLLFSEPQNLSLIRLFFVETAVERSQEYRLRWSDDGGKTYQDIVRQQWNFSPRGSTRETEQHKVELKGLNVLELLIRPDISNAQAVASLEELRLA